MGWQWHQLYDMQIICTSLQTDSHASTSPLSFYRPDALPAAQRTVSKHWRQKHILLQVVKVILHKATSPLQPDGSVVFTRWCQCALPWGHGGHIVATWWMWLNLCFLGPTWVHNPNSKSIGSAIFAQLTAESHNTLQWAPLSPKLPFPVGVSGPHLAHGSVGPLESSNQMASRSDQPFLQVSLAWQTHSSTDRPHYWVGNDMPHLR